MICDNKAAMIEHLTKVIPEMKESYDKMLEICEEKDARHESFMSDMWHEMCKIEQLCEDAENGALKKRVVLNDIAEIASRVRKNCERD